MLAADALFPWLRRRAEPRYFPSLGGALIIILSTVIIIVVIASSALIAFTASRPRWRLERRWRLDPRIPRREWYHPMLQLRLQLLLLLLLLLPREAALVVGSVGLARRERCWRRTRFFLGFGGARSLGIFSASVLIIIIIVTIIILFPQPTLIAFTASRPRWRLEPLYVLVLGGPRRVGVASASAAPALLIICMFF